MDPKEDECPGDIPEKGEPPLPDDPLTTKEPTETPKEPTEQTTEPTDPSNDITDPLMESPPKKEPLSVKHSCPGENLSMNSV